MLYQVNDSNNNNKDFSLEHLKKAWEEVTQTISNNQGKLYGILSSVLLGIIEEKDKKIITLNTIHSSHVKELNKIKDIIRNKLSAILSNNSIEISVTFSENKKKKKVNFYTDSEKVEFFIKKNSALKTLIDKLNLQIDLD